MRMEYYWYTLESMFRNRAVYRFYNTPFDSELGRLTKSVSAGESFGESFKENFLIAKNEIELAQAAMKRFADVHRSQSPQYPVGSKVWLNRKYIKTLRPCLKLDHKRLGPFEVLAKIGERAYRLKLTPSMSKMHNVFHVSLLTSYLPNPFPSRSLPSPPPILIENQIEYEVQDILDVRKSRNRLQYLVSWRGHGPQSNTWEPFSNLTNCSELIDEFYARFPKKPRPVSNISN